MMFWICVHLRTVIVQMNNFTRGILHSEIAMDEASIGNACGFGTFESFFLLEYLLIMENSGYLQGLNFFSANGAP